MSCRSGIGLHPFQIISAIRLGLEGSSVLSKNGAGFIIKAVSRIVFWQRRASCARTGLGCCAARTVAECQGDRAGAGLLCSSSSAIQWTPQPGSRLGSRLGAEEQQQQQFCRRSAAWPSPTPAWQRQGWLCAPSRPREKLGSSARRMSRRTPAPGLRPRPEPSLGRRPGAGPRPGPGLGPRSRPAPEPGPGLGSRPRRKLEPEQRPRHWRSSRSGRKPILRCRPRRRRLLVLLRPLPARRLLAL